MLNTFEVAYICACAQTGFKFPDEPQTNFGSYAYSLPGPSFFLYILFVSLIIMLWPKRQPKGLRIFERNEK